MIRFGSMSITLAVAALYGLLLASLLWWSPRQRLAHRFLALLILVIAARMFPYIIGYAGYYDAYPWLSFLPWNYSLAFGPLLYLHVVTLTRGAPPRNAAWHLLPAVLQGLYYMVIFLQPLPFKDAWDTHWQRPLLGPLETALTFLSMGAYVLLSLRHYRAYQRWLADHVSDRDEHQLSWIRNALIALALTLLLWMAWYAFELVQPLDYFQRFPLYLWLALLTYYLGTEGWRHAGRQGGQWVDEPTSPTQAADALPGDAAASELSAVPAEPRTPERDWAALGKAWRERLVAEGWWRDPDLSLASLARKLGTNTSHLSRAINEGLGMNFNELINLERVRAVQDMLAEAEDDPELLETALAAGFRSKASFNRAFKTYAGMTPSEWRLHARQAGRNA